MRQISIFDSPIVASYHVTTDIPAAEQIKNEKKAKFQDEIVLEIFKHNSPISPSEVMKVWEKSHKPVPLTSLRRAISNLTRDGHLTKTELTIKGMYGQSEHLWKIN